MLERPRFRLDFVPVVFGVLLIVYRFANLDLVTFINDEPHLLEAADREAHGGAWALASPIAGTQRLHYGPVPTWFYGVVHLLFGSRPVVSIVAMGLLVTCGQIFFVWLLTRKIGGGPALLGALLALIASSPFSFAWSRTAWDNTVVLALFGGTALLYLDETLTTKRALVVGLLFGATLGSHLMVLPALVALFVTKLVFQRKNARKWLRSTCIIGGAALLVDMPYVVYLMRLRRPAVEAAMSATSIAASPPHPFDVSEALSTIASTFLRPAHVLSVHGVSYFFDDAWRDLHAWAGPWSFVLDLGWLGNVLALAAVVGLVLSIAKPHSDPSRKLAIAALAVWVGHALFLLIDGLDPHPHYQHPVWWTVPTGLALLVTWLRARRPRLEGAALAALGAVALLQFCFLPLWMHYVRERGGTQGIHFTTPLMEEQNFLRLACPSSKKIAVENHTVIFASALDYLAKHEAACVDHTVEICAEACLPSEGTKIIRLGYANAVGAHLAAPSP